VGKIDWKLWAGLAVLGGVLALGGTEQGRNLVVDLTLRGRRLSRTNLDQDLKIAVDPAELARAAAQLLGRAVEPGAYALGRMLRSEEGSSGPEVKRLLAWVCMNDAEELGWSLLKVLTFSTVAQRKGYFGKQITRRYSTAQDPYEQDLLIAEAALDERDQGSGDPTAGSVKFVNKKAFSSQAGASSYEAVRDRWAKEGLSPTLIAGAPTNLVFFRRTGRLLT
jgi:hypothetical protein